MEVQRQTETHTPEINTDYDNFFALKTTFKT